MKKTTRILLAAFLGLGLSLAMPVRTYAQSTGGGAGDQTNPSQTVVSDLDLEQSDIRDALKLLFKNVGISYTVAPEVQGSVTVSLHNVPFETALQNILKQVDATYRVEAGVFNIVKREETTGPTVTPGEETTTTVRQRRRLYRIKIQHADPELIMMLLSGVVSVNVPPEISALSGGGSSGGMGGGMGGGGRGGMGGGGIGGGGIGGGGMGGMGGGGGYGGGGGIGGGGIGGGGVGGGTGFGGGF